MFLISRLHHTASGILCLICNDFLPVCTFKSFAHHCKSKHQATLHGPELESAFDAVVEGGVHEIPMQIVARTEKFIPCVVRHCAYVAWIGDKDEAAALDQLCKHLTGTHHLRGQLAREHALRQGVETGFRRGRNSATNEAQGRAYLIDLVEDRQGPAVTVASATDIGRAYAAPLRNLLPECSGVLEPSLRFVLEAATSTELPSTALSATARSNASPLFAHLGWYHDASFYSMVIGRESLCHHFAQAHLLTATSPSMEGLFALSYFLLEVFISSARLLRGLSPRNVRECWTGDEFAKLSPEEAEFARIVERMFLSDLSPSTKQTYARGFSQFLAWLFARGCAEGRRSPFKPQLMQLVAEGKHEAMKEAAGMVIQEIVVLEWGRDGALGTFTQYIMAYALVDGRTEDERHGVPPLSQLMLCTTSAVLAQAKVLRYVARGVVIVMRLAAVRDGRPDAIAVSASKSMATLNSIISFARSASKAEGGRKDVAVDLLLSEARGTPYVRVVLATGVEYLGFDNFAAGCTRMEGLIMDDLRNILLELGAPLNILEAVEDPVGARLSFAVTQQRQHFSHLMLKGEDIGEAIHKLAAGYLGRARVDSIVKTLGVVQERLWWLLIVGSGASMRSTDSRALQVSGREPKDDVIMDIIYAHSECDLHIVSRPRKTSHLGVPIGGEGSGSLLRYVAGGGEGWEPCRDTRNDLTDNWEKTRALQMNGQGKS